MNFWNFLNALHLFTRRQPRIKVSKLFGEKLSFSIEQKPQTINGNFRKVLYLAQKFSKPLEICIRPLYLLKFNTTRKFQPVSIIILEVMTIIAIIFIVFP